MAGQANADATAVVLPTDKKKREMLEKMLPELRVVALALDEKVRVLQTGNVMIRYDIGAMIAGVMANEKTYGLGAVETLAAYRNESPTTLYALKDFAKTFPNRDYVRDWTNRPMANGDFLTEKHWMVICRFARPAERERHLKKALDNNLSANDLLVALHAMGGSKNVRSGGRKPAAPATPLGGLQRFGSLAQSLCNYEDEYGDGIFGAIDDMAPDAVNEVLFARLAATKQLTVRTRQAIAVAEERIDKNLSRVEEILKDKAAKSAAAPADGVAEEGTGKAAYKPKAGGGAAAADNGEAKPKPKPKAKAGAKPKAKKSKKNKPAAAVN
jgi:hypothetical protein